MSQATLRRVGVLRLCGIVRQVNKNEPTKSVANKMFAAELFTKRLQQQLGARRTQHLAYLASSCNIPATLPLPLVSIADFFGGPRRVGAAAAGTCPKGASSLYPSLFPPLPLHVGRGVRNFKQIFTQAGPGPRSVQDDHQVAIGCGCGCDHYVFTAAIFGATFMQNKQPATCLHPSILHRRRQSE